MLCYSRYIVFSFQPLQSVRLLTDAWPSTKRKMTHLINSTCLRLWSTNKRKIWNIQCKHIVHGTWKKYENDFEIWKSLLMTKQTDVRDSSIRPFIYVIAHLIFHIVKKQQRHFSLYSFLFPFFPYCFIDVIISCY